MSDRSTLSKDGESLFFSYHFLTFLYQFTVFPYPVAKGMYQSFLTKIESVGSLDSTAWSTGVHMSSRNY